MACPESGAVIRTNRKSSAALVTISALRVASAASRTTMHRGAGDQAGRVELVEDVGHPQDAVEADRGEQQPERQQAAPSTSSVEHHQNGPPRVT